MFLALRWPQGWDAAELARVGAGVAAAALFVVALFGLAFASGKQVHRALLAFGIVTAAVGVVAVSQGWTHPLALDPAPPRTSAAPAALALGFVVAGLGLLAVILVTAWRGTVREWSVSDPRDQGGAVAGYLASYLLPLLNPDTHGARIAAAYAIYLVTLYIIFVRSQGLVTINPMFYLFGYRIFDVQLETREEAGRRRVLLISKEPLKGAIDLNAVSIGDDCYVVVGKEAA